MIGTTKRRILEVVLAGALFALAGDFSCFLIMRGSIRWDAALATGFALSALAGGLSGGLAWWGGRGQGDAPAWRVALIGLVAVLLGYPAWVFLMGLHLGATYSPSQVLVYSAPLFLISGKFTVPMGLLAAFATRGLLRRCERSRPTTPRPAPYPGTPRRGPRSMTESARADRHDPARRDASRD